MVRVTDGGNSKWDSGREDGEVRSDSRWGVHLTGAAVTTNAGGERTQKRGITDDSGVSVGVVLRRS